MKFRDLKKWFRLKRGYEKLFLFFIILRPIVEPYYFLKESSALLSPLYWIGFLTFLITLIGVFSTTKIKSNLDTAFNFWTALVLINVVLLIFSLDIIAFSSFAIRLTYPVLAYLFLRTFIKNKRDLIGLLTLFLYASALSSFWLFLDISKHGFNLRDASSYADVVNYGFYASFALIILLYFYYQKKLGHREFININMPKLFVALVIILMAQWSIRHLASIAIMILITGIFLYYLSQKKKAAAFGFVFIMIIFGLAFGDRFYADVMEERVSKEVEVVEGTREQSQAFHGRMTRWETAIDYYANAGFIPEWLGYPFTMNYSNHMIGITVHNDFLRILFFTGIVGIAFYFVFIAMIIRRIRLLSTAEKFLAYSSMATFIMYSVSTVPTFYPGFCNFSFTIIAFLAMPVKRSTQ